MRRLWVVLLGVVTAGLRSWARLWGRVASAAERRLTAGVQAMGPPAAAGSQDAPASGPPAHWLAHIQARAPGVTFRRFRAPGRAPSQAAAAPVSQSAGLPPLDHEPQRRTVPQSAGLRPPDHEPQHRTVPPSAGLHPPDHEPQRRTVPQSAGLRPPDHAMLRPGQPWSDLPRQVPPIARCADDRQPAAPTPRGRSWLQWFSRPRGLSRPPTTGQATSTSEDRPGTNPQTATLPPRPPEEAQVTWATAPADRSWPELPREALSPVTRRGDPKEMQSGDRQPSAASPRGRPTADGTPWPPLPAPPDPRGVPLKTALRPVGSERDLTPEPPLPAWAPTQRRIPLGLWDFGTETGGPAGVVTWTEAEYAADRWPELPVQETAADRVDETAAAEAALRDMRRRQRLEQEQQGVLCYESLC